MTRPTSDVDGADPDRRTSRPQVEQTRDDTDEGWGDWREREEQDRDRWIEEQRPPHWG